MKPGCFITLEGGEGVGKTTNLDYIHRFLNDRDIEVVITREPGGVPVAEKLRELILDERGWFPEAELLLIFSGRIHHVREKIVPALSEGKWVISDRFTDASYAYQGSGRGVSWARIKYLETWLLQGCHPHRTFLLDAPVEVGLSRARTRGDTNRFEDEARDFMERVRQAYLKRWEQNPGRIQLIDASQSITQVQKELALQLEKLVSVWKS